MMTTMTKKALLAALKERLAQDDRWALRALTVVYMNQTADERRVEQTIEHNGIGFSGPDAEILSSFARQYQQRAHRERRERSHIRARPTDEQERQ